MDDAVTDSEIPIPPSDVASEERGMKPNDT